MNEKISTSPNRRRFLQTTAAGAAFTIAKAESVFGAAANSKIELGIIGCGGRGQYIGKMFMKHAEKDVKIVALQDPFADRLETARTLFEVDATRTYKGIPSFQELLKSPVDAVAITSPPFFHPDHAGTAVKAGKHVWLAKPVAVDVPGCLSIAASSEQAQEKKLNFLVDFQTRNSPGFKECVSRVHKGDIGEIVLGHVYYHAGRLSPKDKPGMSKDEARLRNWVFDIKLSGDIIVEQNIHVLDVANWYIQAHPLKAYGTGGRKARVDVGDCWDHFIVTFWYPNDVKVDFSSAQFTKGYDDLCIRMYGSKGTADSHYEGHVRITGDNPWNGPENDNTMEVGVANNVKDFVEAVRTGVPINHGRRAAESSLTTILGRTAAYEGRLVTWDEIMAKKEKYEVEIKL